MTLRLLLVRHGLSSFNREKRIQGRNNLSVLTPEGQVQACKTGEALASLSINAVYSSPLQRAAETTKELLGQFKGKVQPCFDQDLLEVDLEKWSGMTIEEVKAQYAEDYLTWQKDPLELTIQSHDGSTYKPIKNLIKQAQSFLKKIINSHLNSTDQTILIVGHNAILRCIILELLGQPLQGFRRIKLGNASISIINLQKHHKKAYQAQVECLNNISHLEPPLPLKGKDPRVILVRHGETQWNSEGRFQGQIDIPLNENGKSQALAAGSFLRSVRIDKAYSSSMSRPKETAELILKTHPNVKIKLENDLIEIGHGLWEGKLESEIKKSWNDLLKAWQDAPETVQMPEGETIQMVWDRAVNCWEKITSNISPDETVLIVAHDAVNKTILCHLLGLSPADIWMIKQGNGGITVIEISKDSNQPDVVSTLNSTSHLGGVLDSTVAGAL